MSGKFTPRRITASGHSLIFIKTAGTYAGFYHANEFIRKAYVSKFTYTAPAHIFLRYDNIHLVYGLTEETTEAYNVKSLGNKMICAGI